MTQQPNERLLPCPTAFDVGHLLFSKRMRVRDAIANPESVLPRAEGPEWQEEYAHWQTRAALRVLSDIQSEYEALNGKAS